MMTKKFEIKQYIVVAGLLVCTFVSENATAQYQITQYQKDLLDCSRIADTQYTDFPGSLSMSTRYEIGSERQWMDVFNGCMIAKGYNKQI